MSSDTYKQAKLLLEKGELEESCKLFTAFIDSQRIQENVDEREHLTNAYNSRGHIKYLCVCFDEAVEDYTEAIKRDPQFAVPYYNRGQIHYRLGRFKLAEKDLEKALELNPNFRDAQLNLEQVKRDLERGRQFNIADTIKQ